MKKQNKSIKFDKKVKSKPGVTQTLLKNAFFQGLSSIFGKIGGLIFIIIIARILLPELFGIYSLVLSIILILANFFNNGINNTLIRYVADALGRKKKAEARSYLRFLLNFKVIIIGVISIVLFFIAKPLALYIFHKELIILPLQIGACYLFILSLSSFFDSAFFALKKVKYKAIREGIFQVARLGFVFLFLVAFKYKVEGIFIAFCLATLIALIFSFFVIQKKFTFLLKGKSVEIDKKRLLRFFGYLIIISASAIIFSKIDILMLGAFVPSEFIGFYSAIVALVGTVIGLIGMGSLLLPIFAQLHGNKLKRGFKKVFRFSAIFSFPCAFGLAYLVTQALTVIYGVAFVPTEYKAIILITGIFLSFLIIEDVTGNLFAVLFQAKEKLKWPTRILLMAGVLNVILNYFLIKSFILIEPAYGIIGAALATLISRYFYFISMAIISKKKLKILPDKSYLLKPLFASIVMLGFLFVFDYFVPLTVLNGLLMILLAACVYIGVMFLIKGLNKEDIKLLKLLWYKS